MQKLFHNGIILTMSKRYPKPEAVLTSGEDIVFVGTKEEALKRSDKRVKFIDLKGRTLMPGFINTGGSFLQGVMCKYCFVDLRCYPEGNIKSIEQAVAVLRGAARAEKKKGIIVGYGYDDTLCVDGRMLEARDLDRVSVKLPVLVIHKSFHAIMANTKAMELVGVNGYDYSPEGGCVKRRSGVATGVFEERAADPLFDLAFRYYPTKKLRRFIRKQCEAYLKQGVTVICEEAATRKDIRMVRTVMKRTGFRARYLLCPPMGAEGGMEPKVKGKHILNGPVKLIMDGNVKLYTAALSSPYLGTAPGRDGEMDYCGYFRMSRETLKEQLEVILKSGRSFAIECNGDRAIDKVLEVLESCKNLPYNKYRRNLISGCLMVKPEQLDRFHGLHVYPSFCSEPLEVWNKEFYIVTLGEERVGRMNPFSDVVKRGLPFSLNCGAPGGEIKPLQLVQRVVCANAGDKSISVEEALKGITIYAAYQYRIEDILGSIEPGKKADFVALNKNPLKVAIDKLSDIQVEKIWIDGRPV